MDKISIIIPIYNAEKYIHKCLFSVVNQTYKNLEIICIDDGSTDYSGKILDQYAKDDNRIVVYHTENRGSGNARNVGLKNFTGNYVGFVDSDDWIEPNMYEVLYTTLKNKGTDISAVSFYTDTDITSVPRVNISSIPNIFTQKDILEYIFRLDLYNAFHIAIWNKLYSAKLFNNHNILFNENLTFSDDVLFLPSVILSKQCTGTFVDKPLYHYYQNPTSIMHSNNIEHKLKCLKIAFDGVIKLYQDNDYNNLIDYVKKDYCYHASVLLESAINIQDDNNIKALKNEILRYFDIYSRCNRDTPERIERINKLLGWDENKMNIAFFGLGHICKDFLNNMDKSQNSDYDVKYVVDNNSELWGTIVNGVPVISPDELVKKYSSEVDGVVITVFESRVRNQILTQLKELKIYNISFVHTYPFQNQKYLKKDDLKWYNTEADPIVTYLDVQLADNCNLNCKGCSHFSNLFKEDSFCDLETYKRDLKRISEKTNLIKLHILGGEPFLNKNINEYINYARSVFPDTEIVLYTNGLLIPKQPQDVLNCLSENDVYVTVSSYKPTMKMIDKIAQALDSSKIKWFYPINFDNDADKFYCRLSLKGNTNQANAMAICPANVTIVKDSFLHVCSMEAFFDKYIEYYNLNIDYTPNKIDIYDDSIDWLNLPERLITSIDLCRFCSDKCREFDWEIANNPSVNDWIVDEDEFLDL